MSRTALIVGSHAVLASHLAAKYEAVGATVVRVPADGVGLASALARLPRADDVWLACGGVGGPLRRHGARLDHASAAAVCGALPSLRPSEVTLVLPAHLLAGGDPGRYTRIETRLAASGASAGARCRLVRTADVVGVPAGVAAGGQATADAWPAGWLGFLHTVAALRREIDSRLPGYFTRVPLRCAAPADAVVDLVSAEAASDVLLRLVDGGRDRGAGSERFGLTGPGPIPLASLCAQAGEVYGCDLVISQLPSSLNAVDEYLQGLLTGFSELLASAARHAGLYPGRDACELTGTDRAAAAVTRHDHARLVTSVWADYKRQETPGPGRALSRVRTRVAVTSGGQPLRYHVAGDGDEPLVILNALGQGVGLWLPLMDRLSGRVPSLVWQLRGTGPQGAPASQDDHLSDAESVLASYGARRFHLLGWCTGAGLALAYQHRHPDMVATIVLLNGSFKHTGDDHDDLDSQYEQNLEAVSRALRRQPALAEKMLRVFTSELADGTGLPADETEHGLAARALAGRSATAASQVREVFASEAAFLRYTRQVLAAWSAPRPAPASVSAPVLVLSGAADDIVSQARAERAARLFPRGRYAAIPGASHYSMHDRPDIIAALVAGFLADPLRDPEFEGGVRWSPPVVENPVVENPVVENPASDADVG